MLKLKPNCEMCDRDLLADSPDARICSYECTFCVDCVENTLHNVCPNCGGGFVPRPIRPQTARREGTGLSFQPADIKRSSLRWTMQEVHDFVGRVKDIPPENR